jgi:hypothetical protein
MERKNNIIFFLVVLVVIFFLTLLFESDPRIIMYLDEPANIPGSGNAGNPFQK